jgi:hypothetical protein
MLINDERTDPVLTTTQTTVQGNWYENIKTKERCRATNKIGQSLYLEGKDEPVDANFWQVSFPLPGDEQESNDAQ